MTRILRQPPVGAAWRDPRLLGLGVVLGLAALTRNEARRGSPSPGPDLPGGAARAAGGSRSSASRRPSRSLVFGPWAIRDWAVFGNPLPGQALANALSITGFDIFAWNDPPTLARYLAIGPARLIELRLDGTLAQPGQRPPGARASRSR